MTVAPGICGRRTPLVSMCFFFGAESQSMLGLKDFLTLLVIVVGLMVNPGMVLVSLEGVSVVWDVQVGKYIQ